MILPQTYLGTLILMTFGLLCAGLWASTYKLAGKLRFEVYYIDFAVGLGFAAVFFAFTFGNLGFDGFSIMDDLLQAHKRQWVEALGAGMIFNLANMFLLAAMSVSSMAVAFPVSLGLTFVIGLLLGQIGQPPSSAVFVYLGCALILCAVLMDAMAHRTAVAASRAASVQQSKSARRSTGPVKALLLAGVGGLLMVGIYPLLKMASTGDAPLGGYSLMLLMAAGAFLSTFVFSLFFMNLPIEGEPLDVGDYFRMRLNRHWPGILGGILWCAGTLAVFVSANTEHEAQLGRSLYLGLSLGGPVIAGICGLLIWKELAPGGGRARLAASVSLLLFAAGVLLVSLAHA